MEINNELLAEFLKKYIADSDIGENLSHTTAEKSAKFENTDCIECNETITITRPVTQPSPGLFSEYLIDDEKDGREGIDDSFAVSSIPPKLWSEDVAELEDRLIAEQVKQTSDVKSNDKSKKTSKDAKVRSKDIDFIVYKRTLEKLVLRSCEQKVLSYNNSMGCFDVLSDIGLRTLIRSGWPPEVERLLTKYKVDDIVDRIKTAAEIQTSPSEFDSLSDFINFDNVVLQVSNNKVHKHSPKFKFASYLNASYISGGSENNAPNFFQMISRVSDNNIEKIMLIQEIMGYIFSNYFNAKKWFIFVGKPNSGKSTLLDLITEIVGKKYTSAVPLHKLHERFAVANLFGKKLNVSGELNDSEIKDNSMIKILTGGGDEVAAEFKGQDFFFFTCKAKLLFCGNGVPQLSRLDNTTAFFDRLIFVCFNHSISADQRDLNLREKLIAEKNYIVSWAVDGLRRLIKNNFIFTECEESRLFKKQFVQEMNNVREFINETCFIDVNNPNIRVHKRDIFAAYLKFCRDNCKRALSRKEFFTEITNLGFTASKKTFRMNGSTPLDGYIGLELNKEYQKNIY